MGFVVKKKKEKARYVKKGEKLDGDRESGSRVGQREG